MPRPPADAPLLSRDLILERALQRLREPGMPPLTWRGLSEELKVKPSALYHYFPSKEALEQAAYAEVLSQLPLPDVTGKRWQDQLYALAHDFRLLYQTYPGIAAHVFRPREPLPQEHAIVEALARALRSAGIRDPDLWTVAHTLIMFFASSFVLDLELGGPETMRKRSQFTRQHAGTYPLLASLPVPAASASEEHFELITQMLIAGVEGLARRAGPAE
ncbi:TetR/AcrR family transcriptional regulator [Deinococcus navajonensis]|uniref:TetR/AcrR family transcriptional regulator n=1 Tax=Deinococcus navajonensis TaxID=309884 RepID=A0ABV8XK87_9DEIO